MTQAGQASVWTRPQATSWRNEQAPGRFARPGALRYPAAPEDRALAGPCMAPKMRLQLERVAFNRFDTLLL